MWHKSSIHEKIIIIFFLDLVCCGFALTLQMLAWMQLMANLKCPLVHTGMKLSDYDRGTPSVCWASFVTWLVVLHFYSQPVQKLGQRSDIQSAVVSMVTWPIKARLIGLFNVLSYTKELLVQRGREGREEGRRRRGGPNDKASRFLQVLWEDPECWLCPCPGLACVLFWEAALKDNGASWIFLVYDVKKKKNFF